MSQSIFHVRPLDAGKGWAIDEYDGRGAWQHSVLKTPEGAPMDKQMAQRVVFQLRRKAVNSAPKAEPINNEDDDATRASELAAEYPQGRTDPACADMLRSGGRTGNHQDGASTLVRHRAGRKMPSRSRYYNGRFDLLSLQVEGSSACRACDGRGWIVVDNDTNNEVVQGTKQCPECLGGVLEPLKDDTGCDV